MTNTIHPSIITTTTERFKQQVEHSAQMFKDSPDKLLAPHAGVKRIIETQVTDPVLASTVLALLLFANDHELLEFDEIIDKIIDSDDAELINVWANDETRLEIINSDPTESVSEIHSAKVQEKYAGVEQKDLPDNVNWHYLRLYQRLIEFANSHGIKTTRSVQFQLPGLEVKSVGIVGNGGYISNDAFTSGMESLLKQLDDDEIDFEAVSARDYDSMKKGALVILQAQLQMFESGEHPCQVRDHSASKSTDQLWAHLTSSL